MLSTTWHSLVFFARFSFRNLERASAFRGTMRRGGGGGGGNERMQSCSEQIKQRVSDRKKHEEIWKNTNINSIIIIINVNMIWNLPCLRRYFAPAIYTIFFILCAWDLFKDDYCEPHVTPSSQPSRPTRDNRAREKAWARPTERNTLYRQTITERIGELNIITSKQPYTYIIGQTTEQGREAAAADVY